MTTSGGRFIGFESCSRILPSTNCHFCSMSDPLVLVTGASGFLGRHVVKVLQEKGYRVRGTVRSLKNAKRVEHLYNLCPNAKFKLELVEADLTKDETWLDAVEGCTYIHHVASPFPLEDVNRDEEIIGPAIQGTLGVMKAAAKTGMVKRIVLTSSSSAVGFVGGNKDPRTEKDWTNINDKGISAYPKSKVLAEKAAWEFVANLPENEKFELAVINPVFILGPVLQGSGGTSFEIIQQILMKEVPVVPHFNLGVCDVRDVAEAHLRCMTLPEAV
ncbi:NADPH-dependent aldehyde reductase ari1-like isoform x2, partial [Plakobranchus ocellatus]